MKTIIEEMLEDREDELKKQGTLDVAKRMKARGDSIDEIIKMTDLTVDDVLKL